MTRDVQLLPEDLAPGDGRARDVDWSRLRLERIRSAVAARTDLPAAITLSGGVAAGRVGTDVVEAVFQRADQALYQAKRNGRDRVEVSAD